MLIRFRVANFRSLRDEQELSLVAGFKDGRKDLVRVEDLDLDLLRAAALYGPNAAGKSNVLAALRFMADAVAGSHRFWRPAGPIPLEPFLLDAASRMGPALFEVDLVLSGIRYQYGFKVDSERVQEEWLCAWPQKRRQLWFARDADAPEPFTFGKHLKGNHRLIQGLTRKNSLFLSVAAENNHPALLPIYRWFANALCFSAAGDRIDNLSFALAMLETEDKKSVLLDLLHLADLGIEDLELRAERRSQYIFETAAAHTLKLKHRSAGGLVPLPFARESRGTQAWLSLAGTIAWVLEHGAVLCLDELDASLHPRLALEVLRLFQDPERNPCNAQLIFNTHDTTLLGNLLGEPALHRDQIWFIEKDEEGVSHLYPLTDFKPRKFENLERGYLQGRYGAIPFVASQVQIRHA